MSAALRLFEKGMEEENQLLMLRRLPWKLCLVVAVPVLLSLLWPYIRGVADVVVLRRFLSDPTAFRLDEISPIRKRLGSKAADMIMDALDREQRSLQRVMLAGVLVMEDTNHLLPVAIDAVGAESEGVGLARFLEGRMDEETRTLVQEIACASRGNRLKTVLWLLANVADDRASLDIAKSVLLDPANSIDEKVAGINLLGNASYFCNDSSAVEILRELVDHSIELRRLALRALASVPGEDAEQILLRVASSGEDKTTRQLAESALRDRVWLQQTRDSSRPCGWRKAAGEPGA